MPKNAILIAASLTFLCCGDVSWGQQQKPSIGYMFPVGGRAGSTVDVILGGYDWTPDMQVFVRDEQIKLELTGQPGPVIVPEPPYWFAKKARRPPFLLPRETPARLTIPPNTRPGVYEWQVANANGASTVGKFVVSNHTEVRETATPDGRQILTPLPATVSGQILKIEDVDRYSFTPQQTGPVTLSVASASIGSPLTAIVEVRDQSGTIIAEAADTQLRDLDMVFVGQKGHTYAVDIYDADFRGNRSFVYRLSVASRPHVVATIPAAIQRGQTVDVEFVGYGLKSGTPQLESITAKVTAPKAGDSVRHTLKTAFGECEAKLYLSDVTDQIESPAAHNQPLALPVHLTGLLSSRFEEDRYAIEAAKGDTLSIRVEAADIGSPLDVSLVLTNSDGKLLKDFDDSKTSTDVAFDFAVPADGTYELAITDNSGLAGDRAAIYRLVVEPASTGFQLQTPDSVTALIGSDATLTVTAIRSGGFADAISLEFVGLPEGVTVQDKPEIPAKRPSAKIKFTVAESAGTNAAMVHVKAFAEIDGKPVQQQLQPILFAVTMKAPYSIDAEGKNDVTKWPRGTTFPAPVLIEREESFQGDIVLEMHSKQGRHRQGITGPELTVPPGTTRILYPVFLPEWLETTRTSRMVVNGVAKVADPKGRVRYLSTKLKTRIGFLPGGALMKASVMTPEIQVSPGEEFEVTVQVRRSRELAEPVELTLQVDDDVRDKITAEPLTLTGMQDSASFRIKTAAGLRGEHRLKIRATLLQDGHLPVVSEADVLAIASAPAENASLRR